MIFSVSTVYQREILQVGIIIQNKIVEYNDTKELQYLNRSSLGILPNKFCTFFVTEIAVFVVTTTIGLGQTS